MADWVPMHQLSASNLSWSLSCYLSSLPSVTLSLSFQSLKAATATAFPAAKSEQAYWTFFLNVSRSCATLSRADSSSYLSLAANWASAERTGAYWRVALTLMAFQSIVFETLATSANDPDPLQIDVRMSEASSMAWRASSQSYDLFLKQASSASLVARTMFKCSSLEKVYYSLTLNQLVVLAFQVSHDESQADESLRTLDASVTYLDLNSCSDAHSAYQTLQISSWLTYSVLTASLKSFKTFKIASRGLLLFNLASTSIMTAIIDLFLLQLKGYFQVKLAALAVAKRRIAQMTNDLIK